MHKIFSFGEILKDVHLRGMSLEEISSISPKEIGLLSKSGKIVSADDGGASANVAAYNCLIGGKAVFSAAVGKDAWGDED